MRIAAALLALLSLAAGPAGAAEEETLNQFLVQQVGAPAGRPLAGAELEKRTSEVASLVRCPVCQGSSIDESPSTMAQNMKRQTHELLAKGYGEEQIIRYFELAYGEFIREKPKSDGINLMLWALPVLVVLGGGLGIALSLRSGKRPEAPASAGKAPGRDELPESPELAKAVLKVRELAYGWPGGVSPKTSSPERS